MEVYHKITPVRSIQQSINLIRALKNEQKDAIHQARPKSVNPGISSDNYGTIPNLRSSLDKMTYLPIKEKLAKVETRNSQRLESGTNYYKTQSQFLLKEAGASNYSSLGNLKKDTEHKRENSRSKSREMSHTSLKNPVNDDEYILEGKPVEIRKPKTAQFKRRKIRKRGTLSTHRKKQIEMNAKSD